MRRDHVRWGVVVLCALRKTNKKHPPPTAHTITKLQETMPEVYAYIYILYIYIHIYCIVCKLVGTVVGFGRVLAPVFVKSVDACERIPRQRGGTSKGIPLLYGYTATMETFPHAGGVYPHYGGIYPSMGVYPQSGGIHTPIWSCTRFANSASISNQCAKHTPID